MAYLSNFGDVRSLPARVRDFFKLPIVLAPLLGTGVLALMVWLVWQDAQSGERILHHLNFINVFFGAQGQWWLTKATQKYCFVAFLFAVFLAAVAIKVLMTNEEDINVGRIGFVIAVFFALLAQVTSEFSGYAFSVIFFLGSFVILFVWKNAYQFPPAEEKHLWGDRDLYRFVSIEAAFLVTAMFIALFFRLYALEEILDAFNGSMAFFYSKVSSLRNIVLASMDERQGELIPGVLYAVPFFVSVQLFGSSVLAIRVCSAVIGVLSIPLAYLLGRELGGRRAAFCAAAFMAVDHLQIAWGRTDVYPHGATTWLTMLLSFLTLRALRTNHPLYLALTALTMGATWYQSPAGRMAVLIPIIALVVFLLGNRHKIPDYRTATLVFTLGFVLWWGGGQLQKHLVEAYDDIDFTGVPESVRGIAMTITEESARRAVLLGEEYLQAKSAFVQAANTVLEELAGITTKIEDYILGIFEEVLPDKVFGVEDRMLSWLVVTLGPLLLALLVYYFYKITGVRPNLVVLVMGSILIGAPLLYFFITDSISSNPTNNLTDGNPQIPEEVEEVAKAIGQAVVQGCRDLIALVASIFRAIPDSALSMLVLVTSMVVTRAVSGLVACMSAVSMFTVLLNLRRIECAVLLAWGISAVLPASYGNVALIESTATLYPLLHLTAALTISGCIQSLEHYTTAKTVGTFLGALTLFFYIGMCPSFTVWFSGQNLSYGVPLEEKVLQRIEPHFHSRAVVVTDFQGKWVFEKFNYLLSNTLNDKTKGPVIWYGGEFLVPKKPKRQKKYTKLLSHIDARLSQYSQIPLRKQIPDEAVFEEFEDPVFIIQRGSDAEVFDKKLKALEKFCRETELERFQAGDLPSTVFAVVSCKIRKDEEAEKA